MVLIFPSASFKKIKEVDEEKLKAYYNEEGNKIKTEGARLISEERYEEAIEYMEREKNKLERYVTNEFKNTLMWDGSGSQLQIISPYKETENMRLVRPSIIYQPNIEFYKFLISLNIDRETPEKSSLMDLIERFSPQFG